jgi:hypothetical protein
MTSLGPWMTRPNDKPETLADQIDPIYGEAEQPFVYDPDAPQDD